MNPLVLECLTKSSISLQRMKGTGILKGGDYGTGDEGGYGWEEGRNGPEGPVHNAHNVQ